MEQQLLWLFGLALVRDHKIRQRDLRKDQGPEIGFAARYILDALEIEIVEPEADVLDKLLKKFGGKFPNTRAFSEFARKSLADVSASGNPDATIMAWIEREEALFRRLERHIVAQRLTKGFMGKDGADIDGFIKFSLSVQNRRKARVGQALEHHLEALFNAHQVQFARGAETENRNKPDFLFPGPREYQDQGFPVANLTMLGAKSTCKDRWRQVLSEAERIKEKHLFTLEPGISENQTDEMQAKRLQLVLPIALHQTYRKTQQPWLMKLEDFVLLVKSRQPNQ